MAYDSEGNVFHAYECDPDKNEECNKTGCIFNFSALYPVCHLTINEKYKWDGKKRREVKNRSKEIIENPEEN